MAKTGNTKGKSNTCVPFGGALSRGMDGFDPSTIEYGTQVVTPDLAAELLGDRPRPTGKAELGTIGGYSRSMAGDRWRMNGDPLVIDEDGNLVSGEMRLWACIDSDTAFFTVIVRGVPRTARMTMGSHLQRTRKDQLTINGEEYAGELAAAWPIVLGYMDGRDRKRFAQKKRYDLSVDEIVALTERYPGIRDSAVFVREIKAVAALGEGMSTASHYLMSLADRDLADAFMRILVNPALDLASAPAAMAVRLMQEKRTSQPYKLALLIKAWNKFRDGKTIKPDHLYYDKGKKGSPGEPFPILAGIPAETALDIEELETPSVKPVAARDAKAAAEGVKISVAFITPAMAVDWLAVNGPVGTERNRKIREDHVTGIRRDMESAAWVFNGQPIKVAVSGRLIDGQHRLTACVESGQGFWTLLIEGLDDEVFTTFDSGQRRGLAATLREKGYANFITLAASIALLCKVYGKGWRTPTNSEGLALLDEHPGLVPAAADAATNKSVAPRAFLAAMYHLTREVDVPASDFFMGRLSDGANLDNGTPLLVFREYLNRLNTGPSRPVTERIMRHGMLAWNAHRRGVNPHVIRDDQKKEYPKLV